MKKTIMTISICGLTLLAACQGQENNAAPQDVYPENGNTINVTDRNEHFNADRTFDGTDTSKNHFGYVRHQSNPIEGTGQNFATPVLDREKLADSIGRLLVSLPNVEDAATLVTDDEILVAYSGTGENRELLADQVKRSAASIAPRYFHVYVSDNPRMFQDIERFGQGESNAADMESSLNNTIKEMKQNSPQGYRLSTGENENGETTGDRGYQTTSEMR